MDRLLLHLIAWILQKNHQCYFQHAIKDINGLDSYAPKPDGEVMSPSCMQYIAFLVENLFLFFHTICPPPNADVYCF